MNSAKVKTLWWLARVLEAVAWPFQWPDYARQWAWEKWNCAANQYWIDHPKEYRELLDSLSDPQNQD